MGGREKGILEVFLRADLKIKQKKKKKKKINTVSDNNGDPKNKEKQLKNCNCKSRRNNGTHKPSFPQKLLAPSFQCLDKIYTPSLELRG